MRNTPVVTGLLLVNTVFFLLSRQSQLAWLSQLALWPLGLPGYEPYATAPPFQLWQLLTYGFLHGNLMHLLLNMYALWLFGRPLENYLGSQRFLAFYLTCIAGSAVFHLLVQQLMMQQGSPPLPMIGASGGTFGLLMAFGYLFPNTWLYLLIPPMPVRAKWFVLGYGIIELVFGVTGTAAGVAHFAHLGGMFTAYLLIRFWIVSR